MFKGYTKEMIKEILGTSWPTMPEDHETGNQMRRRKGQEMSDGKIPYPTYPAKKGGPQFDENGNYNLSDLISFRYDPTITEEDDHEGLGED